MLNLEQIQQLIGEVKEALSEEDIDEAESKLDEIASLVEDAINYENTDDEAAQSGSSSDVLQSDRGKEEIERNKARGEEENTATTPPGKSTPERDISEENK